MNKFNQRSLAPYALALVAAGCVDFGSDSLSRRSRPDDPRYDELSQRLNVDIRDLEFEGSGFVGTADCNVDDGCTPEAFSLQVAAWCSARAAYCPGTDCTAALCQAEMPICIAHRLLEIANQAAPTEQEVSGQNGTATLLIPPQDAETNAELARLAFEASTDALSASYYGIYKRAGNGCEAVLTSPAPGREPTATEPALSYGDELALSLGEAYFLALEAEETSRRFALAAADANFAREREPGDANFLAFTAPYASRASAAHLLVGGASGVFGMGPEVASEGFFTRDSLSADGQAALQLLRIAAPAPSVIHDFTGVPLNELILGFGSLPDGSTDGLRHRLAILLDDPALETMSESGFYERLGIRREGFVEARAWLSSEIRAFDRPSVELPPQRLSDGTSTADRFPIYAATRTEVTTAAPGFWAAVARYNPTPTPWTGAAYPEPIPPPDIPPGSGLIDPGSGTHTAANVIEGVWLAGQNLLNDTTIPASIRGRLRDPLTDADDRWEGHMRVCWYDEGSGNDWAIVNAYISTGDTSASRLRIARSHGELDCAVLGSIAGAPCTLPAFDDAGYAYPTTGYITRPYGEVEHIEGWARLNDVDPGPAENAFLVSLLEAPAGMAEPGPGDYRTLATVLLPRPETETAAYRYCVDVPIVPGIDDEVGRALAPDPNDPLHGANSCAGVPNDLRIPLENELTTDDGDSGPESSWRHYLRTASEAAALADQLGEDLIRNGLDMDLRAEAAIDELEDICGVSLNIDAIGGLDADARAVEPMGGVCPAGYIQPRAEGSCIRDPFAAAIAMAATDEDAARLEACLGASTSVPWTTLGSRPVCAWEYPGLDGSVCANRDGDHPCPTLASIETVGMTSVYGCDSVPLPSALMDGPEGTVGPVAFVVDQTLQLFMTPDPDEPGGDIPAPIATSDFPCEWIARMHDGVRDEFSVLGVPTSPFMQLDRFRNYASRLNWVPAAGDFSRVTFDGSTVASTGSVVTGPGGEWPCTGAPPTPMGGSPLCPEGHATTSTSLDYSGPLFCLQNVCGGGMGSDPYLGATRANRARANDLLARAVLAARIVSGASLNGLRVPFYARNNVDGRSLVADLNGIEGSGPGWSTGRVRSDGATIYDTFTGTATYDQDPDAQPPVGYEFGEFDAYAERVTGGGISSGTGCTRGFIRDYEIVDRGAEWILCPYDRDLCVEVFDDQLDCDDATALGPSGGEWDGNMPLLVRTLGRETDGSDPGPAATEMFTFAWTTSASPLLGGVYAPFMDETVVRTGYAVPASRAIVPMRYDITTPARLFHFSRLSGYWRRSSCGAYGGGNCEFAFGSEEERRHPDEEADITRDMMACPTSGVTVPGGVTCDSIGCRTGTFDQCLQEAEAVGLDFADIFDGNRAFIASAGLTHDDVLNGLELTCMAARGSAPDLNFGCDEPPTIERIQDVLEAESFMRCRANGIRAASSYAIIGNLPSRVVELLAGQSPSVYGEVSGEYGAEVAELRSAFLELRNSSLAVADTVDSMATEIRGVRNAIARSRIADRIEDLSLQSSVWDRTTSCVQATTSATVTIATASFPGGVAGASAAAIGAAATCVNSSAQIEIASRVRELRGDALELETESAFIAFESNFNAANRALTEHYTAQQASLERIDAALARIRSLQDRGRRAMTRALFLDSDDTGRHMSVDSAMRRRYNTSLYRYLEAHRRAIRLAFIARRALEQRLGMNLASLEDDLVTVEAPAEWADSICTLPSIDYDRIRGADPGPTGERMSDSQDFSGPAGYAGAYVGDYVRRLEQVFESYSFNFPFEDGTDTVTLSLRDDVLRVRDDCEVEGPNLLYQANHLDVRETPLRNGWRVEGCADLGDWPTEPGSPLQPNCVSVRPMTSIDPGFVDPIGVSSADLGRGSMFRVEMGVSTPVELPLGTVHAVTSGTRLSQWTRLSAGRYRVSWYAPRCQFDNPGCDIPENDHTVSVLRVSDRRVVAGEEVWTETELAYVAVAHEEAEDFTSGWHRYWGFIELDAPSEVIVAVGYRPSTGATHWVEDVGAIQLDDVTEVLRGAVSPAAVEAYGPGPFFDTTDQRTRLLPSCEDTDGNVFRTRFGPPDCELMCPGSPTGGCDPETASRRCYREVSFPISADQLALSLGRSPTGFAAGNYNYRFETIGVNLVGTGLRNCGAEGGFTPGTCYASGNVFYSIAHGGPFLVRDARGALYSAPIFPGRLTGRAVAAERYLTNPLSSADRALIDPYTHPGFQGRPLWGQVTVRLWTDEGFVFDNLEDVQLVLGYRYWIHQR